MLQSDVVNATQVSNSVYYQKSTLVRDEITAIMIMKNSNQRKQSFRK